MQHVREKEKRSNVGFGAWPCLSFFVSVLASHTLLYVLVFFNLDSAVPQVPPEAPRVGGVPGHFPSRGRGFRVQKGHHGLHCGAHDGYSGDKGAATSSTREFCHLFSSHGNV